MHLGGMINYTVLTMHAKAHNILKAKHWARLYLADFSSLLKYCSLWMYSVITITIILLPTNKHADISDVHKSCATISNLEW